MTREVKVTLFQAILPTLPAILGTGFFLAAVIASRLHDFGPPPPVDFFREHLGLDIRRPRTVATAPLLGGGSVPSIFGFERAARISDGLYAFQIPNSPFLITADRI